MTGIWAKGEEAGAAPNGAPTVFLVDDNHAVLRSLHRLLRSHGFHAQSYDSPLALLDAIVPATPGCVLLDLSMPEISGLELQERLLAAGNHHPIVFLSGSGTIRASVQALQAGALDFIEKPVEETVIVAAVQRAIDQDRVRRAQQRDAALIAERLSALTPREDEVFRHVIAGRLNKQIAARLGTAEKTIKVHRARVMHKMGVKSVAELTRLADFVSIAPAI